MLTRVLFSALCAATLLVAGCERAADEEAGSLEHGAATGSNWLLAQAPADAVGVAAAKASAAEGDEVVVRGRIGGRKDPMSADSPVFIIMDPAIPSCADNAGDGCPTPWDYCCETPESLAANTATVQLVDETGTPLVVDATASLEPLDEVIVTGTVGPRPEETVLTIRATGVHRVSR
jgi:hypothetical protein